MFKIFLPILLLIIFMARNALPKHREEFQSLKAAEKHVGASLQRAAPNDSQGRCNRKTQD